MTERRAVAIAAAFVSALSAAAAAQAAEYLQITRQRVNIRTQPGTSSQVVAQALEGDVFQMLDRKGEWYSIVLFSGERRYVHGRMARRAAYVLRVPESRNMRREVFRAWQQASDRARLEADRRHPPVSELEENIRLHQFLEDRYKLEVMHRFQLQPPVYRHIVIEGNQKGW